MTAKKGRNHGTKKKRFLRIRAVMDRTGLSRSGVYSLVYRQMFPQPYKLGPRAVAWLEEDVDHWFEEQISRGPASIGAQCDESAA